ncbi:Uncharacterised protein [Vibrio cholerae]|nr:Uncharacterised protein [Vibrio cholerae]
MTKPFQSICPVWRSPKLCSTRPFSGHGSLPRWLAMPFINTALRLAALAISALRRVSLRCNSAR